MEPIKQVLQTEREIRQLRRLANQLEGELYNFCRMALQPGQTKTVGGKTYVWQVGRSGKARWHRSGKPKAGHDYKVGYGRNEKGRRNYHPQETRPGSKMTVPIRGRDSRLERELEPGETPTPTADTMDQAITRAVKNRAVKNVSNRPYLQSMLADRDGDGVDEGARVGIPAKSVQPPPPIKRVKGLTGRQEVAEAEFITLFEDDPKRFVQLATQKAEEIGKSKRAAPIFETDAMKDFAGNYWGTHKDKAMNNVALHQTANAICKMAFKQHLAKMPKGSEILVTCGGCGAGKGHTLNNNPLANGLKEKAGVIWDSAGDQNSTENPWILEEARKHGHKVTFLYVHTDPYEAWANPNHGVVQRAMSPKDGRMVTTQVFADSYALGAKNFSAFAKNEANKPDAKFVYFKNGANPEMIAGIPPEGYHDSEDLNRFAEQVINDRHDLPSYMREAATFSFGN